PGGIGTEGRRTPRIDDVAVPHDVGLAGYVDGIGRDPIETDVLHAVAAGCGERAGVVEEHAPGKAANGAVLDGDVPALGADHGKGPGSRPCSQVAELVAVQVESHVVHLDVDGGAVG